MGPFLEIPPGMTLGSSERDLIISISGDPAHGGWVRSIGGGNCCTSVEASAVLVALVKVCVVLVDGLEAVNLVMIGVELQ